MTPQQKLWILEMAGEAVSAEHIQPRMAACEAALESGYGTSALARAAYNFFGMKQHVHPVYGSIALPTKEFLGGEWVIEKDIWVKYENAEECFADRMATLIRLRDAYPHYQAALTATDPLIYVREVSQTWSTDPARADKCIAIFQEVWPPSTNREAVQDAATGENG